MIDTEHYVQAMLALLFVLALLAGLSFLLKRSGYINPTALKRSSATMRVLDSITLDAKHRVLRLTDGKDEFSVILGGQSPVVLSQHPYKASKPAVVKDMAEHVS